MVLSRIRVMSRYSIDWSDDAHETPSRQLNTNVSKTDFGKIFRL